MIRRGGSDGGYYKGREGWGRRDGVRGRQGGREGVR